MITNRERMLCAYCREEPDQVPVSPELWYDFGVLLDTNCTWQDICFGRYPLWLAMLVAHRYFGSAAWLLVGPGGGAVDGDIKSTHYYSSNGDLEFHYTGRCPTGSLKWRVRHNATFCDWMCEHPIKDLERDLPVFATLFMPDPDTMELAQIDESLEGVGGDGIVTAYVGSLFFSFLATHLEGGPSRLILAMLDQPQRFEALQQQYIRHLERIAERIATQTDAQILMLENGFSTAGIISPAMYAKWDVPVVKAVADIVHKHDSLLHLHHHGKCCALIDLIVSTGADLVEPFERPPSGDTPDLSEIKRHFGDRIAIRGNLHAHDTLLRGTPIDVEVEVRECLEAAAEGGGFILASGDGVIVGTPCENIFRMVEAGEKYGKYGPTAGTSGRGFTSASDP